MLSEPIVALLLTTLAGAADDQSSQPFRISVNVDLVVLNVTVRDREGRSVSDLHEQDFDVRESGVRQSIRLFRHEDLPVTVGLVVDHSGSMRRKLKEVVAAVRMFVASSSPDDEMFVVNFNEHVTLGLPGTVSPEEVARTIASEPAAGQTALYDAIVTAQDRLQASSREKKVLVVISDGGDNASTHGLNEVLRTAAQSSTVVYTIGIFDAEDPDRNPGVLRRLASETGGEAFFPNELAEVATICERIARDIRSQYTLGYIPTNPARPGVYRGIRVHATGRTRLFVRTRSGYIGGSR